MTTISDLVRDVSFRMHSYTGVREQVTYLTSPVDDVATTLQVGTGDRVSMGLIEVDDELMLVDTVESNEVRLLPFGRAQEGTAAVPHALNARVTNDPLLPRQAIFQAVVDTMLQIHPQLYAVRSTEIVYNPARYTYGLPADVDRILEVTADQPGPSGVWPRLDSWALDKSASPSKYPTGRAIRLDQAITPGYVFRVTYAGPYGTPASMADDLDALGIQDSVREVVVLGACWRLVQNLEPSRLQMQSVEQLARETAVPVGSATSLAKQLYAQFQLRVSEERERLQALHPFRIHRTR